jgi:AbiTii
LNGFYKDDPVPKYREVMLHSKGNFTGISGIRMTNRPLPLTVLDKEHWDLLTHRLVQPIAAYETFITSGQNENPSINWPPDLIVHYQEAFFDDFILSSAWQEVPFR